MTYNRGLKRLAFFVVFFIPVAWYSFLQLFGSNSFSLGMVRDIPVTCGKHEAVTIVHTSKKLNASQVNNLDRATRGAYRKDIGVVGREEDYFSCLGATGKELLLISGKGLWGIYPLSRDGVDRLLTELDILLLQETYGKDVGR